MSKSQIRFIILKLKIPKILKYLCRPLLRPRDISYNPERARYFLFERGGERSLDRKELGISFGGWGMVSIGKQAAWDVWQRHDHLAMVVVGDGDFFA